MTTSFSSTQTTTAYPTAITETFTNATVTPGATAGTGTYTTPGDASNGNMNFTTLGTNSITTSNSQAASPLGSTTDKFLVVGTGTGQTASVTMTFTNSTIHYFGLLWGSADAANTVTLNLLNNGTASQLTFKPANIGTTGLTTGTNDFVNFFTTTNAYTITSAVFSYNAVAFEIDNVTYGVVPEAGTGVSVACSWAGRCGWPAAVQRRLPSDRSNVLRKLVANSSGVSVAVPSLPTTTLAAWLPTSAACSGVAPAASASVKSAMAVSPAPDKSNTSRLARLDRVRRLPAPEQQHPCSPRVMSSISVSHFSSKPLARPAQHGVSATGPLASVGGIPSDVERLDAVGLDGGHARPAQVVARVGIDGHDLARAPGQRADLLDEVLREKPLGVVLDDDGVEVRQHRLETRQRRRVAGRVAARRAFAVHADDVLLPGDDARLDDGRVTVELRHGVEADVLRGKQALQNFGVDVVADDAHDGDVLGELAQVARDVGRAAGVVRLFVTSTMGTGASGEIRLTRPQMNSSSIRSPMTSMRLSRKRPSSASSQGERGVGWRVIRKRNGGGHSTTRSRRVQARSGAARRKVGVDGPARHGHCPLHPIVRRMLSTP